jgi:serralysin
MAWSSVEAVTNPLSGNRFIDSLIANRISYNYELPLKSSIDFTFDIASNKANPALTLEAMNDTQKSAVRGAIGYIASVTGIKFNEVAAGSSSDIVFGYERKNPSNAGVDYSDYNAILDNAGNVVQLDLFDTITMNANNDKQTNPVPGTDGYLTVLHEVGHALGMKHPFEPPVVLQKNLDNETYTVMSYTSVLPYSTVYGPIDIAALRYLYGGDGLRGQYGLTVNASGSPIVSSPPNLNDTLVGLPGPDGQVISPAMQSSDDSPTWQYATLGPYGLTGQADLAALSPALFDTQHKGAYEVMAQA